MNCQHCGTELDNKRAKNCKTCSTALNDANRQGVYSFVMEAISQAKADGLTGSQVHEAIRLATKAGKGQRNQWADDYRAFKDQLAQERREWKRQEEDAHLDIETLRVAEQATPRPTAESEIFG
jgi:hypothetical protein